MPSRPKKHRDMGCEYHYKYNFILILGYEMSKNVSIFSANVTKEEFECIDELRVLIINTTNVKNMHQFDQATVTMNITKEKVV